MRNLKEKIKDVFENKKLLILILFLLIPILVGCKSLSADIFHPNGKFVRTGDMTVPRNSHAATLLQDGRVLITGGLNHETKIQRLSSAEIYNPKTGKFTKIPDMTQGRWQHQATLLQDGRVLITGGYGRSESAEIYDPKTNKFTKTGDMNFTRTDHSAILLNNGKVLIIGGHIESKAPLPPNAKPYQRPLILHNAELYDPATGKFTLTPKHKGWYAYPAVAMLPDGRVLVIGDFPFKGKKKIAEIYNPEMNSFTVIDYESIPAKISNDKMIFLGFREESYARLYDINTGKFIQFKSRLNGRADDTTTLLNNNKVLIIGAFVTDKSGYVIDDFNALYDIKKDNFTRIQKLGDCFGGNTATLLNNGDVLIAGGIRKDKANKRKRVILKEAVLYKY